MERLRQWVKPHIPRITVTSRRRRRRWTGSPTNDRPNSPHRRRSKGRLGTARQDLGARARVQANAVETTTAQEVLGNLLRQIRELRALRNDLSTAGRTQNVSPEGIASLRDLLNSDMVKYKDNELRFLRLVERERQQARSMNIGSNGKTTLEVQLPADALKEWLVERRNQAREGNTLRRLYDQEDKIRAAAKVAMRQCGLEHFEREMKTVVTKINEAEQRHQTITHENKKLQRRFLLAANGVARPASAAQDGSAQEPFDVQDDLQPVTLEDIARDFDVDPESWLARTLRRPESMQIKYNRFCGRLVNKSNLFNDNRRSYNRLMEEYVDNNKATQSPTFLRASYAQQHLERERALLAELDIEESAFMAFREVAMAHGINPVSLYIWRTAIGLFGMRLTVI
jgi:hypothetical protein